MREEGSTIDVFASHWNPSQGNWDEYRPLPSASERQFLPEFAPTRIVGRSHRDIENPEVASRGKHKCDDGEVWETRAALMAPRRTSREDDIKIDEGVEELVRKFKLDEQATTKLANWIASRPTTRDEDRPRSATGS